MLRICQIGCGSHARQVYIDSLAAYRQRHGNQVQYVACCDLDAASAASYAQLAGFSAAYSDTDQMLREQQPDAVLLTTPFTVTGRLAQRLLADGIPTLMEKPPAESYEETIQLVKAAAAHGTHHQVAYNRRHIPLIRALRQRLHGHRIEHIECAMHRVGRRENHFHTTAIHDLDLACYLAGSPLRSMAARYPAVEQDVINAHFLLEYENGAVASLSFCPVSGAVTERIAVTADNGLFVVDLPAWGARSGSLEHYRDGVLQERIDDESLPDGTAMFITNGFYAQLAYFFDHIAAGKAPAHTLSTCLDTALLSQCMADRIVSWQQSDAIKK